MIASLRPAVVLVVALGWTSVVQAQVLTAVDDLYGVPFGAPVVLLVEAPGVLDNDTYGTGTVEDAGGTAELIDYPNFGALECDSDPGPYDLCPDGSFSYTPYTPYAEFPGFDSFTYQAVVDSQTDQATVVVTGCKGGTGTTTVCWSEGAFLAKLADLGYGTIREGFEDDGAWGSVRDPDTAPSVPSQGITWQTNHPDPPASNELTTGGGRARTGSWGVYDPEHGYATGTPAECDVDTPPEHCKFKDGFTGTGSGTLYAVGGFFTGTAQPSLVVILDGGAPIGLGKVAIGSEQFFGVIDTAGFSTFRFEETDGKVGQLRLVFADDFTIATGVAADTVPPQVAGVDSYALQQFYVTYDEPVDAGWGYLGPDDVTNPANYLLFDDGGDGFDTPDCVGGVATGDNEISVDWVTYVSGSALEATLDVNGGAPLPGGSYRLLVCGTTSIKDWAGNPLDGDGNGSGGDDYVYDFTVNLPPVADDQSLTTPEETALPITLTATDPDGGPGPLTYSIVSLPSHGELTGMLPSATYDPDLNYVGPDSFTFRAYDGAAYSNVATVSIDVTPVPDPPIAGDNAWSVGVGGTLTVPAPGVLANDTDPDGDGLTAVLEPATGPSHAAAFSLNADGSFGYTHDGSGNLSDSFQYRASDGVLTSAPATVTITVLPGPSTWYVATTGSDLNLCTTAVAPCLTVQEGAGRAASGDTVQIAAGVYAVTSMVVGKNLALVGQGITTVLDAGGAGMSMGATGGFTLSMTNLALGDTP